jgi:hypothetical protein
MTMSVIRWLPLVKQELLIVPGHLDLRSLFCIVFCRSLFVLLLLFLLVILLSVLRFTESDYPLWYVQAFLLRQKCFANTSIQITSGVVCFFGVHVAHFLWLTNCSLDLKQQPINLSILDNWFILATLRVQMFNMRYIRNVHVLIYVLNYVICWTTLGHISSKTNYTIGI